MAWSADVVWHRGFDLNSTSVKRIVVPVGDAEVVSVQAFLVSGTWSTAVVTLLRTNEQTGARAAAFSTPITLSAPTSTASTMTDEIDCTGFKYLVLELTTVEGSTGVADFAVYLGRRVEKSA